MIDAEKGPIQKIVSGEESIAIIIRASLPYEGHNIPSDPADSLQVGMNHYKKGHRIPHHFHLPVTRHIENTMEVAHIDQGEVEVSLFNKSCHLIGEVLLKTGDTIIFLGGGHGFRIMEDTRMLNIKQGPYGGETADKVKFSTLSKGSRES